MRHSLGMRRRAGVGRFQRREQEKEIYGAVGSELASAKAEHVEKQVGVFRAKLEEFARKHRKGINRDPEFRRQFQIMCKRIGVDPLVSSKGFWAEILGIGDFYYELGVQVTDACISSRDENGGLMDLAELRARVHAMRAASAQRVSEDDLVRAVDGLRALGNGFKVVRAGARDLVVSVPVELNHDHSDVLLLAQRTGHVTQASLSRDLGWSELRASRALKLLLDQGMAWIDGAEGAPDARYWFITVWNCRGEGSR